MRQCSSFMFCANILLFSEQISISPDDFHRTERKMLQGEISTSEASEKESMAKMEALRE